MTACTRVLFATCLSALWCGSVVAQEARFASVVREHFASWDSDKSGTLMPDEIDRLTVDPAVKGEEAAAVATIKLAMRAKRDPIESLALEDLDAVALKRVSTEVESDEESGPSPDGRPSRDVAPVRSPTETMQARFTRSSRVIRNAKRELFLDDSPDLDKLRQGRIGDCFFVAVVGAMVERDPQSVKRMISSAEGGGYRVEFPGGRVVAVPPLTDAEFALSSTTGDEGVWLPVLEKALGTIRMAVRPEDKRAESMTDAISRGGNCALSIGYLTAHRAETVRLLRKGEQLSPAEEEKFLQAIRAKISAGIAGKRLMSAGTDAEPGVPKISPNHAYAIMGFDETTDVVHLWNPHGNAHRLKGEPGRLNGYETRAGRFDVPLRDFVGTFRRMFIETDQPFDEAQANKPRRERKEAPTKQNSAGDE